MSAISPITRSLATTLATKTEQFAVELDNMIAVNGTGYWGPAPLWHPAILTARTHAGGMHSLLEQLTTMPMLAADIARLPDDLRREIAEALPKVKATLDEIHLDKGGTFTTQLKAFQATSERAVAALKQLVAEADSAPARDTLLGADVTRIEVSGTPATAATAATQAADGAAATTRTAAATAGSGTW